MSNSHATQGKLKEPEGMWANGAIINGGVRQVAGSTNVRPVGETAGFSGAPSAHNSAADK